MAKKKKSSSKDVVEKGITDLGSRFKQLRKKKEYTNYEIFAYEHGIGRSQYGKYEKGTDMQWSTIVKLIDKHGMTIKEFFSEGFD